MSLTAIICKTSKPKSKTYKLYDEKGLYLLVETTGSKYWRLKYRLQGKEKLFAIGVYPTVTLKEARTRTLEAKKLISEGIDPVANRKNSNTKQIGITFEAVAREWFNTKENNWSPSHKEKQEGLLNNNLIPYLGKLPITSISTSKLLTCLRVMEDRGALESARRTRQIASQIFVFAISTDKATANPSANLSGALKTPQTNHYPSITEPVKFGALLRAIDDSDASFTIVNALKLSALLFVRPGELRSMKWAQLDFKEKQWEIPATSMKMKKPLIVPLSTQSIAILQSMKSISHSSDLVFPSVRSSSKRLSENTLNATLRRIGYTKEEMVAHGFRASARTMLEEYSNFSPHLLEQQLSHRVLDTHGRAYNRTSHLPARSKIMQAWADFLDCIKDPNWADNKDYSALKIDITN